MSDHQRYRKLVSVGNYEHILVEWEIEVPTATVETFQQLTKGVDKCANLAKHQHELLRELKLVTQELDFLQKNPRLDSMEESKTIELRIETIRHELEKDWMDIEGFG